MSQWLKKRNPANAGLSSALRALQEIIFAHPSYETSFSSRHSSAQLDTAGKSNHILEIMHRVDLSEYRMNPIENRLIRLRRIQVWFSATERKIVCH